MILSESHAFAFIHVPKTAGSSVFLALRRYAAHPELHWSNRWLRRVGIKVNHFAPWPYTRFRPHAPAAVLESWLPAEVFEGLFKFGFVRNPWDLLVSYWTFIRQTPGHKRHRRVMALPSFAHYVEYEIRRGSFSQVGMLCGRDGRVLVDFVGRFESLEADFAFICRRIGIDAALPKVNVANRGDYREFYTPALVDRVGEAYADDIERFGYVFEAGVSAASVPRRMAA
jgi:hypothetical protein